MRALAALALALGASSCSLAGWNRPVELPEPEHVVTASGVECIDLSNGEGAQVEQGARVELHYIGRVHGGGIFDSSYDRGLPMEFTLGAGEVVPGWEEGLIGMRPGGRRRITIPPERAYGEEGLGNLIPPDATLVLDVELLAVELAQPNR